MIRHFVIWLFVLWTATDLMAQVSAGSFRVAVPGKPQIEVVCQLLPGDGIKLKSRATNHIIFELPESYGTNGKFTLALRAKNWDDCEGCKLRAKMDAAGKKQEKPFSGSTRFFGIEVPPNQSEDIALSITENENPVFLGQLGFKISVKTPEPEPEPTEEPLAEEPPKENPSKVPATKKSPKDVKKAPTPSEKPKEAVVTTTEEEKVDTTTANTASDQVHTGPNPEPLPPNSEEETPSFPHIPTSWMYIGGGITVVLLLLFTVSRSLRKKPSPTPVAPAREYVPPKSVQSEQVLPETGHEVSQTSDQVVSAPAEPVHFAFKTKKKNQETNQRVYPAFDQLRVQPDYVQVDLTTQWGQTLVDTVFLFKDCIDALDRFITDHNVRPFNEGEGTEIPEIGGFLLGRHQAGATRHQVSLEKFVPIESSDQGVYKIEFGTQAWVALDNIRDQYPDLTTIGWFHTHPGHGLFLSKPDLNIQGGFFRKPFQLAMEIDTLTGNVGLDTAFFTWQEEGKMNNSTDRKAPRWLAWQDLMDARVSQK